MNKLLFIEPNYFTYSTNLKLLRVELTTTYTKIDFGYQPFDGQTEVKKIKIHKDTYLSLLDEKKKFKLVRTSNMPIAPKQHIFKTAMGWLFFSLYFEPVPVKYCDLNLIESEVKIESDFNFLSIELDKKKQLEIK